MLLSKLQLTERVSLLQVACELTPEHPPPFQLHSKAPTLQHSHYHRHKVDDSRGFYLVLTNASGIGCVSCVIFISSADWWKSSLRVGVVKICSGLNPSYANFQHKSLGYSLPGPFAQSLRRLYSSSASNLSLSLSPRSFHVPVNGLKKIFMRSKIPIVITRE